MPKLGEAYVNIRANLAPLKRGLAAARGVVSRGLSFISGTFTSVFSTIAGIVKSTMNLIIKWTKRAAIAISAAFGIMVWKTAKFQTELHRIATMLDKNVKPQMDEFQRDLIELSKQFGQTTAVLGDALFDILSASIAAEKAAGLLTIAGKLAVGGVTDIKTATSAIITIIKAYKMEVSDATDISDKLFAAFKRGRFTIEELSSNIGNIAATAALAGLSFEGLLATIATMTRGGVGIQRAMFALNALMLSFVKPTDSATEAAKKFDVELSSATLRSKGLLWVIKKLKGASAEEAIAIAGSARAIRALAITLQDVAGFTTDLDIITQGFAGRTEIAYRKMAGTLTVLKNRAIQAGTALMTAFGENLKGAIARIITRMDDFLQKSEEFVRDNAPLIKEWSNRAVDAIMTVVDWFGKLFDIASVQGIGAALTEVFDKVMVGVNIVFDLIKSKKDVVIDTITKAWKIARPFIEEQLIRAFDYVRPYAEKLGKDIADGFKENILPKIKGGAIAAVKKIPKIIPIVQATKILQLLTELRGLQSFERGTIFPRARKDLEFARSEETRLSGILATRRDSGFTQPGKEGLILAELQKIERNTAEDTVQ